MKNINLLEIQMCIITNNCNLKPELVIKNIHEEIPSEKIQDDFYPFNMDEIFAN
jgi:hypothetical protein